MSSTPSHVHQASAPPPSSTPSKDSNMSLTTILHTPQLRLEFAVLIFSCIDSMRKDLSSNFEVAASSSEERQQQPSTSSARFPASPNLAVSQPRRAVDESLINIDVDVDTKNKVSTPLPPEKPTAPRRQNPRQHAFERARLRERLAEPQIQGLRRAALTFFDAWRLNVLRRVGEAVGVRGDTVRRAREERLKKVQNDLLGDSEPTQDMDTASKPKSSYEAIPTSLLYLDLPAREHVVHCTLLLLLGLSHYPAHSRILLLYVCASLHIPQSVLISHETSVSQILLSAAQAEMSADESTKRSAAKGAEARKWKIGFATVAGAALIGVTGGLAAPLLATGVGTVFGGLGLGATATAGLLGSLAGSGVLVGGLFGAYGGKMTGRIVERYAREVRDFSFVPLRSQSRSGAQELDEEQTPIKGTQHRLRVAICISGWLTDASDITVPWRILSPSIETFALRYELEALLSLGATLSDVLKGYASSYASYELIRRTVLGTVMAGLWPLGLVRAASVLDNPFSIAKARSDKAGKVLADALMSKVQGERPVTLVGYSLGARVIFSCLQTLAQNDAVGLVESVVLMGAPVPTDSIAWRKIKAVVTGRVVNVYSTNDLILGFLYRASSVQLGVAGLEQVRVPGVENVDVSKLVSGHTRYRYLTGSILSMCGFEELDGVEVTKQQMALEEIDRSAKGKTESGHGDQWSQSNTGIVDGKVEMLQEQTGKIVMVDLESSEMVGEAIPLEDFEKLQISQPPRHPEVEIRSPVNIPAMKTMNEEHTDRSVDSAGEAKHNDDSASGEGEEEDDGDEDGEMAFMDPSPEPEPENVRFGSD
ncbi:DUF726-domain-containing protein [Aulographum hederae CBS 113979]|uniref:DUF726-domain-containing protein n=1 Tax=Aulographum hederae CBS 113979 TaxID=1176131 RepID=A0A6G1GIU3_9PEZI|nr:DUF726-domain-containing protein [Aulographum hederae CBS 113979]